MFENPKIVVLINQSVKAAVIRRLGNTANDRRQGAAMLQAFGAVAADVLGLVTAPAGWELAVIEAVDHVGMPPTYTPTSGTEAKKSLQAWEHKAEMEVRTRVEAVGGDPARHF